MGLFSGENDDDEWKVEFEKDLRDRIARMFAKGERQINTHARKKKRDLIPILERIKVDFSKSCPEYIMKYQIFWDVVRNYIIIDIDGKLSPALQEFVRMETKLPKYSKENFGGDGMGLEGSSN
jgi:hypothetical protein